MIFIVILNPKIELSALSRSAEPVSEQLAASTQQQHWHGWSSCVRARRLAGIAATIHFSQYWFGTTRKRL